jgi:hypothetical protein
MPRNEDSTAFRSARDALCGVVDDVPGRAGIGVPDAREWSVAEWKCMGTQQMADLHVLVPPVAPQRHSRTATAWMGATHSASGSITSGSTPK